MLVLLNDHLEQATRRCVSSSDMNVVIRAQGEVRACSSLIDAITKAPIKIQGK